jgi:YD repeat-containing protein
MGVIACDIKKIVQSKLLTLLLYFTIVVISSMTVVKPSHAYGTVAPIQTNYCVSYYAWGSCGWTSPLQACQVLWGSGGTVHILPPGSGVVAYCIQPNGAQDGFVTSSKGCPVNSQLTSPTCTCNTGYMPDATATSCIPNPCPSNSSPLNDTQCACDSGFVASQELTACVAGNGPPIQPPPPPDVVPRKNFSPCPDTDCGNPINTATGLKHQTEVDYRSPSGLEFKRTYNSLGTDESALAGSFGTSGWRLDWQRSIRGSTSAVTSQLRTFPPLGNIIAPYGVTVSRGAQASQFYIAPTVPISVAHVIRGAGKVNTFNLVSGTWTADSDINDRLTSQPNAAGGITDWTYTTEDRDVEHYNPIGQLISITDRAGQITTLTYSDGTAAAPNGGFILDATGTPTATILPAGRLIRITDTYQRSINLGYDASSRIVKMTDPANGLYSYAYDTNNNLVSVTYPNGKTKQYLYENVTYPHALTGITDENGTRYATYAYDSNGRAVSTEHAGGAERFAFTYSADGSSTSITDAVGTVRTQTYQVVQGVIKSGGVSQPAGSGSAAASSSSTYDVNGNIASRTDFNGNLTTYAYDLTRNLETSRTEGLTTAGAKTAATRTINTAWDTTYRLPASITEQNTSGASAVTLRITNFTYDPSGNLLTKTITDGQTPTITRTDTYTYDTQGHRLSADGPRTDVSDSTTYTYYAATDPDLGKRGNLSSVTNALGQVTNITSYDLNGRPLSITDPNGLTTTLGYDPRGRLLTRDTGGETTAYTYDGVGQLLTVTLPSGAAYTYTYDAAHRLTQIADGLGNQLTYTLDNANNRIQEQLKDSVGNVIQTHSRVFDALSRLYQDIGAVNQTTTYAYDANGNLTSVSDPLNRATTNAYDALNRLITSTDAATGQTHYGYNALDQLTQVTDPRSLVTQYSRDGLNDLNQQVSPDTGTTTNTYDAAGNVLTRTDAKGQVATYSYDALNRLTGITYTGAPTLTVTYQYDLGTNGIGHLTQLTDSTGVTNYGYDQHGRLVTETEQAYSAAYTTAYTYDAQGRLAATTYPSGRTVSYTFDSMGRINEVDTTLNSTTNILISNISYEPFGGIHGFTYGDGQTAPVQTYTRSRDWDGRIASYSLNGKTMNIGYDTASQIAFVSDPLNLANTANYSYDPLGRLASYIQSQTSQTFDYDLNGSRVSQTVGNTSSTYTYLSTSNKLSSIQIGSAFPQSLAHDANGATTSDYTRQYAYDVRGRLIQTTTAQGIIHYEVNALGLRVRKQVTYAGIDTEYHYDAQGHLISEGPTGASQFSREYIYLGDIPVAVMQ